MALHIIDSLDGLNALETAWSGLEAHAVLPMQEFIWAQACASVFAGRNKLRVVVLEEGGEAVAIAPLVQREGSARLEMLGVAQLFEPADVLCATPAHFTRLARVLIDLGVPLYLRRLPSDSPFVSAFRDAPSRRGIFLVRPDGTWPWITLDAGWAEPESKFNSKRRAYLRRARRLAEEMGTVSSEVQTPTPETLHPLLDEAMAVEAASWKGRTGTALAQDSVIGGFYRRYAESACAKGILRLCFLRIDGKAAAMQIGLEDAGRFWLLKIGYDEQYQHCAPGNVLIRETVSYAARRGLMSIAFLGMMESWKEQWTSEQNPCVALRGYPLGPRGMSALAGDLTRTASSRVARLFSRRIDRQ